MWMMKGIILAVLACFYSVTDAEANCEMRLPAQEEFDVHKVMGTWFLQYKSKDEHVNDPDYKCVRHYYTQHEDGTMDTAETSLHSKGERKSEGSSFLAPISHNSTDGVIYVYIQDGKDKSTVQYHFVSTDYTNYNVVSFCLGDYHGTYVFSRKKTMSPEVLKSAVAALEHHKKTLDDFTPVDQIECP